jgi:tubulin polyglutamylase TTLL5
MIGKDITDLENQIHSRDQDLMLQAQSQMQLRERFKQLKGKGKDQILQDALLSDQSTSSQLVDENRGSTLYYRVIKNRADGQDIISKSFQRKPRWTELPHGLDLRNTWNILWSWSKIKSDLQRLLVFQRANYFIGDKNVSRKDFLKKNIELARKFSAKAQKEFNIMPQTFEMPREYTEFLQTFSEHEEKEGKLNYWIIKPAAKAQGKGIRLVNEISQITFGEPMVIQRYLKNPLLLNGYKFDFRIYVVVTSVNPLEAFIYKEGFGRFSTQPYTLDPDAKANSFIHLTNTSINNKNLKNYEAESKSFGGTKVALGTLKKVFQDDLSVDWETQIWTKIKAVVTKSLIACQNDIVFNPCCFRLYGFDVILDSDLRPWLLEINTSPSLACDTALDEMVKQRLIDETLDLVNPVDFDRKRLVEVLERRL